MLRHPTSHTSVCLLAFAIHVVLLLCIFDVYYRSPVVQGIGGQHRPRADRTLGEVEIAPPARRLVLFTADGLRAHTFFEQSMANAPFLRSVMLRRGRWGVSNTHVPTESRPGHVAILAGLYEDVSAVTRGWQHNPVEFDSILNQSSRAFAWGSPDTVGIFQPTDAAVQHVKMFMYDQDMEDFGAKNASLLDVWVYEQFDKFMKETTLTTEDKEVVFFLHLLGIDTTGHGHKPQSDEYRDNVRLVDELVRKVEGLVEAKFPDSRTTYVFTADHGMTDWGSHGAGHDHETMTPLVVWGSGVPPPDNMTANRDGLFGFERPRRNDVEQADIAPLMAAYVGVNIPKHSVGRLPLDYLGGENVPDGYRFRSLYANAAQLRELYNAKREPLARMWFRRSLFHEPHSISKAYVDFAFHKIQDFRNESKLNDGMDMMRKLPTILLEGIDYFHRYQQPMQGGVIASLYVAFILFLLTTSEPRFDLIQSRAFVIPYLLLTIVVTGLQLPLPTHVYTFAIVFLVVSVLCQARSGRIRCPSISALLAVLCGVELLVGSFFDRRLVSLASVGGALVMKVQTRTMGSDAIREHSNQFLLFSALSGVFPFLPTIGRESYREVVGTFTCISGAVVIYANHAISSSKVGLPFFAQIYSWTTLLLMLALPHYFAPLAPTSVDRLSAACMLVFAPYALLCLSFDVLFYIVFCLVLLSWTRLEIDLQQLSPSLTRLAYFTLQLAILAFFGTGNIASLNSFDPTAIQTFVTVFRPFVMASLLVLKVPIPLVLLTASVHVILHESRSSALASTTTPVFLTMLAYADVMALHFFFLLRDSGSWLQIGESISHYAITLLVTLVLILLHAGVRLWLRLPAKTHVL